MKHLYIILFVLPLIGFGQYLDKIEPENLIGVKIKFLKNNWSKKYPYGHYLRKIPNTFESVKTRKYRGRTGEITDIVKDQYNSEKIWCVVTLDNNEKVFFKYGGFCTIPTGIGIIDLLEKSRELYIGQTFYIYNRYTNDFNSVKIKEIYFSEDKGKYTQLNGPVKVIYTEDYQDKEWEGHLTTTYTTEEITYDYQKDRVFEYFFKIDPK